MTTVTQQEINDQVWRACDTFRGAVDPSEYKNYILTMLFLKFVSDLAKEKRAEYSEKYGGDQVRVERAMQRERFILPQECDFDHLYAKRDEPNIGELLNTALVAIEDANRGKLDKVFRMIDFNSEANLGEARERNRRLKSLLDDFASDKLDFKKHHLLQTDIIGNVYQYLIKKFAADAGKKGGEFYTPGEVSDLLACLLKPQPGNTICDPACGSGSLLIRVAQELHDSQNFSLFGMESNGSTWALAKMNMFLHGMDSARIEWCNTLADPKLVQDNHLMTFDIVAANPPFSLDKWGAEEAASDRYKRYEWGIPPKSKGDYSFILHMIATANDNGGKVGVIVPHGVLFRGGSEGAIRKRLLEENLLDAVIGLPSNLFFGTGIPAAILLFRKNRQRNDILFIDASRDYADDKKQNRMRPEDIDKIVAAYEKFESVEKYAHRATLEEIRENDYNLNIPRYVDTFEEEEEIDIAAVQKEIEDLEKELVKTRAKMAEYLKELGV